MTATDQLAGKLLDIINQIQTGIVAHGADAMNLALAAVQLDGWSSLMYGLALFIIFIINFVIVYGCIKKYPKYYKDYEDLEGGMILQVVGWISGLIGGVSLICALFTFFDFWTYVQIANPKVYLAHQIIEKVMQ